METFILTANMANIKQLSARKVTRTFANFEKLTGLRLDRNQKYVYFSP